MSLYSCYITGFQAQYSALLLINKLAGRGGEHEDDVGQYWNNWTFTTVHSSFISLCVKLQLDKPRVYRFPVVLLQRSNPCYMSHAACPLALINLELGYCTSLTVLVLDRNDGVRCALKSFDNARTSFDCPPCTVWLGIRAFLGRKKVTF